MDMDMNEYKVQWEKARKQKKLEERYNKDDSTIALCKCGNYFKKVYFKGLKYKPSYRANCIDCTK